MIVIGTDFLIMPMTNVPIPNVQNVIIAFSAVGIQ